MFLVVRTFLSSYIFYFFLSLFVNLIVSDKGEKVKHYFEKNTKKYNKTFNCVKTKKNSDKTTASSVKIFGVKDTKTAALHIIKRRERSFL